MSSETVLQKILKFVKVNSIWILIGSLAGIVGVPASIWAIKDHNKKPDIGVSIAGFTIPEDNPCHIYYLIPEEYYDGPMDGAVVFELFNSGTSELSNVYAMISTRSVYDTKQTLLFSAGNTRTVEQQELRFRRFVEQEYRDDIAGEQISLSYNGSSEVLTFVCKNLPMGMLKCVQPRFVVDREYEQQVQQALSANQGLGRLKCGRVFDAFSINISYAATGVPARKINDIPVIVAEETGIDGIVKKYEEEGIIRSATIFSAKDIENGYVNSILIYPKYIVEDGVINVSLDEAQYYYVKYDTFFKEKRKRKISVLDLNTAEVKSYTFKDTPERKAYIKKFYDEAYSGYQAVDKTNKKKK